MPPSARREVVKARAHAVGLRIVAATGDKHVELTAVGIGQVEPVEAAAVGARHDRVVLPAQAEIQRQFDVGVQRSRTNSACCHSRAVISSFCTLLAAVPTSPSRNEAYWL